MALPTIVLEGRTIILLNGYSAADSLNCEDAPLDIDAEAKLHRAVMADPDAIAFGYVCGHWVAGA